MQEKLINIEQPLVIFRKALAKLRDGKGTIIGVTGDSGYGKTTLLNVFLEEASKSKDGAPAIIVESQKPIGKFNIASLQPLKPFSDVIDKILHKNYISPERKFAMNIGLTLLTAIPIAGDAFYAAKELGRDFRQYKKDKSSSRLKKVSSVTADYFDSIRSFCDKNPCVLLMDDMHWADAQSVELLQLIADDIDIFPIALVFTFTQTQLQKEAAPLIQFVRHDFASSQVEEKIFLREFHESEISTACMENIPGYRKDAEFEKWLKDRSYGIPAIVMEYIRYFNRKGGIANINFDEKIDADEFLPPSVQAVFASIVGELSEDEKNTLAICSAEGPEFTVNMVSHLLNTDVLSTIKTLRALQNKTGFIRSLGAIMRYGVKTTVYRFSQTFYHSYFENTLEYEEYQALHGEIASFLKQKYDEIEDVETRQTLAPFIAAHSAVSGYEELAREMITESARASEKYDNPEVIRQAWDVYNSIGQEGEGELADGKTEGEFPDDSPFEKYISKAIENESGEDTNGAPAYVIDSFASLKHRLILDYNVGRYEKVMELAREELDAKEEFKSSERIIINLLCTRAAIECGDEIVALRSINEAATLSGKSNDSILNCLILNLFYFFHSRFGRRSRALDYLKEAAQKSVNLSAEIRMITLSNIGFFYKEKNPAKAKRFLGAALEISGGLEYTLIESELSEALNM